MSRAWDELLAEFRVLGGTAENVRLGEGALGRGLFAIDPGIPIRLAVPDGLLVDAGSVVFEDGALRLAADAGIGARERKFVEDYHAHLSWGGGGRAEIARILEQAQELPGELRRELLVEHRCGRWFEEFSDRLVEQQFVASRRIAWRGRDVMMPILDLANHGGGATFEAGEALRLETVTQGEVLVRYSDTDAYGVFLSWGFASEQAQALSIELVGEIGSAELAIGRVFGDTKTDKRPWIPDLDVAQGHADLDFLMLGNRFYPRLPRGIFRRVMRDGGLGGADESFDTIQHVNRAHFLALLGAVETVDGAMARTLRAMARHQLEALSFCVGARDV
jgi:hypothetical protein